MAPVPGERRQQTWPSTVAYIARLVIHRYAMLGVLDEEGLPLREMGILRRPPTRPRRGGGRADGRRALPRMRQRDADPQGRLRVLHRLRLRRGVRVTAQRLINSSASKSPERTKASAACTLGSRGR